MARRMPVSRKRRKKMVIDSQNWENQKPAFQTDESIQASSASMRDAKGPLDLPPFNGLFIRQPSHPSSTSNPDLP